MAKRGLGRGLDALLPDIVSEKGIEYISLDLLDPLHEQARQSFDDEALAELAQSIKRDGVLSPLIVVKNANRYRIVAGERRFRASRKANIDTVPCIVKDFSEDEIYKISLIENIQRENLNPLDEAEAYKRLIEKFNYTQEQLADGLSKNRSSIANSLRLNNLSSFTKENIRAGKISMGHAKVLAGITDKNLQDKLSKSIIDNSLSVRALEALIKQKPSHIKKPSMQNAELEAFQRDIKSKYGIQADIKGNLKKGKIILKYTNEDELNTLYNILNSGNN